MAAWLAGQLLLAGAALAAPAQSGELKPQPAPTASDPEPGDAGSEATPPSDAASDSESAVEASPESEAPERRARRHFEEALGHYRDGEYRAAEEQLKRALTLDPESRDLIYNLALVNEKLGELDEALALFRRLLEMESDAAEMERVERAIRRLEGALREREEQRAQAAQRDQSSTRQTAPPRPTRPRPVRPQSGGRLDGWVVGSSGVAAIAAVTGVVLAVTALVLHPGSDPRTSAATSIDELQTRADTAGSLAVAADVSFAVSAAAGTAALTLYLAREAPARTPEVSGPARPAAAKVAGLAVWARF